MNSYNFDNNPVMRNFPYNWAFCFHLFPPNNTNYLYNRNQQLRNPEFESFPNNTHISRPELSHKISNQPKLKVEEPECSMINKLINERSNKKVFKSEKENKTYKSLNTNIINLPKPEVIHSVKYFDPSSAPALTSALYNQICGEYYDHQNLEKMKEKSIQRINQLEFKQQDKDQFIIFKYRRIKKKYRRYLKNKKIQIGDRIDSESDSQEIQDIQFGSDGQMQDAYESSEQKGVSNLKPQSTKKQRQKLDGEQSENTIKNVVNMQNMSSS